MCRCLKNFLVTFTSNSCKQEEALVNARKTSNAVTSESHLSTRKHLVQPISPEIHQMAVEVTMTSTDYKEENILSACDAQELFDIDEETSTDSKLRIFTYCELRLATMNFHPDKALGEGGFGTVYKGWIDVVKSTEAQISSNIVVAVKMLNQKGMQGHREWLTEVKILGQLHHPHLVKLIGYSYEKEHRLLVYEFMQLGSLDSLLFERATLALSWVNRIKIALGAAKGLAFLHGAEKPVIYRDFKPSNILIDSDYTAKLSDFGLAKLGPKGDKTHVTTRVMGTHGYAAPEYLMTGHLTTQSDVYGFGVVLLELITGRQAIDKSRPRKEQFLVEWALPYLSDKRKLLHIMDLRLDGMYSVTGAQKVANVTKLCLSRTPKHRPPMKEVVQILELVADMKDMSDAIYS